MDLQPVCIEMQHIAREAGAFIKNERLKVSPKDIELKGKASLVTYVDKNAEKQIVKALRELLPEAGFITEEETITVRGETWNWVIDPLDGTTNFLHGIYPHSVAIALMKNEEPVAGVVYEIGQDELFSAVKGEGAFLNGYPIGVSESARHEDVLIATGFPYSNFELLQEYLKVMEFFMIETRGLRRLGSAAVDLCYTACGRFDGFFEYALHIWDIAAGLLILKEAGGKISDFKGGKQYLSGEEVVAASTNYYPLFFAKINQYLGQH